MSRVIFVQDFFADELNGGAELHDKVIIDHFEKIGILHSKIKSFHVSEHDVLSNTDKIWFVSNFVGMKNNIKALLAKHCRYFIYEHDYKFDSKRNPIHYSNFIVPQENKINVNFYSSAEKVICLSKMHRKIFDDNLGLPNIVNTNCSMWSDEDLELFIDLQNVEKNNKFAVIKSSNPIKKTPAAVEFCKRRGLDFDLISSPNYHSFIAQLSKYKGLVFMTGHPEPTPRVAIEAKMLNCKFISQKELISVAHEDYFSLTGLDMINKVKSMRDESLKRFLVWFDEV